MSSDSPYTQTPYTQTLREAEALAVAGGKGANLGELIRAGFPVPDGFVVTTAAYDRFVADNHLAGHLESGDPAAIPTLFEQATLAPELAEAIDAACAALGRGAVAVRSSATAEDLPGASFAGQLETWLNVSTPDAVRAAVVRCWASLWGGRAVAYRARLGPIEGVRIAVVVQRLVAADVAGVLFTANPTNGRRDETVITAAWGLGESVVGGSVETDEYVVRNDEVRTRIADKAVMSVPTESGTVEVDTPAGQRRRRTLTDPEVRRLTALGHRVAVHFGVPQDIEWVRSAEGFQLVQARPITALPEPVGEVPSQWRVPRPKTVCFRASIVEQMPDPLTPLFADLARTSVPGGLHTLIRELRPGIRNFGVEFPTINGYAYYDYPLRTMAGMVMALLPGGVRLLGTRDYVMNRWRQEALPRYRREVAAWESKNLPATTAPELLRGAQALLDAGCLYYTTVQTIIPMASTAELVWTGLHDRLLRRKGGPAASDYLLGFDSAPILAEKSLYSLAQWCRQNAGLTAALTSRDVDPRREEPAPGVDAAIWEEWRRRFEAHLAGFGHMTYTLDVINPVPADDPAPVVQALRYALGDTAPDPFERQARLGARREEITRELLERLDPIRASLARRRLASAHRWGPIREDALAAMGLAWPVIRRLLHELGQRLVAAGVLTNREDIFWLTLREASSLAEAASPTEGSAPGSGGEGQGLQDRIAERQATWRGQALAHPPQYLPQNRLWKQLERWMPARAPQDGPVLEGTTGFGARVSAPARVLSGPQDFGSFQPGEVLVASITTPAYTPLFPLAAAVVTDIGGVLSHGSIVAREYGIPAVLGTGNATQRIRTGDLITVDGIRGEVLLPTPAPG